MSTTIGILAHVDAGKTTLAEQLLYRSGTLRSAGRVDQGSAFLDHGSVERERGITISSDQASFSWKGREFHLIDTPGHVDFSGEMERCLWVMDCAVLVVSSVEGIQSHTETVWRLLREHAIPTFLFLNKLDRAGAEPDRLLAELHSRFGANCPDFSSFREDGMGAGLAEHLAEMDDRLLERYFEGGYEPRLWLDSARRMTAEGHIFPAFRGAALNGEGIMEFLDGLCLLAPEAAGRRDVFFSGKVYQVRHEKQGGRVVFVKVDSGILRPRMPVETPSSDEDKRMEKVNELRRYSGARFSSLEEAGPGSLCAVTGLLNPKPGDIIGEGAGRREQFRLRPLLSARALFDRKLPSREMLDRFRELEDEEPLLGVEWEEETQSIHLKVMGDVQLEILAELFRERYGIAVSFGESEILYRETIAVPVVGCGHFEPLRHYAEVHLRLSPGQRGSGVTFESECPTDLLASNWQNLIRTHVLEREHRGVLTGAPLTDVRVALLAGRAHLKHTEGGDFREATYRAVRQGLMNAQSILLEPWYSFRAEVEPSLSGRVLSDVLRMGGTYDPPETAGELALIRGRAPVAEMRDYARTLTAFSKGKGRLALAFDGYEPCRDSAAVVAAKDYKPERDLANTPDSVFCSHGAGFPVKWYDAPKMMHIKL